MSTAEKAENRPAQPAPSDKKKESRDVIFAMHEGKNYEIPMNVAKQYESRDAHDQDEGDEVGGRHRTYLVNGTYGYHSDWLHGTYVWITDGRTYSGYHWHPNQFSPYAYDMDNY